jgi:hypothetical protein
MAALRDSQREQIVQASRAQQAARRAAESSRVGDNGSGMLTATVRSLLGDTGGGHLFDESALAGEAPQRDPNPRGVVTRRDPFAPRWITRDQYDESRRGSSAASVRERRSPRPRGGPALAAGPRRFPTPSASRCW